jgi:8-oxo-(d)GTP phosphatase
MKTLVIIRHAHRDLRDRSADNGLSKKGRSQAREVKRFYRERFGSKPALLLSSPKRRCVETLEPLAKMLGGSIRIEDLLKEGEKGRRVKPGGFLFWWRDRAPCRVVACSHGDWIPAFLKRALGADISLKKGGWAELELARGHPKMTWLLQTLS